MHNIPSLRGQKVINGGRDNVKKLSRAVILTVFSFRKILTVSSSISNRIECRHLVLFTVYGGNKKRHIIRFVNPPLLKIFAVFKENIADK
jgi:hypothetical protein